LQPTPLPSLLSSGALLSSAPAPPSLPISISIQCTIQPIAAIETQKKLEIDAIKKP